MITNNDGFNFINTITRKERQGSPLTPDRYNNYLNICFEEKLSDAFSQFEKDQRSTDFFRFLKVSEVISPDIDGEVELSSLSNNYFHITGSSYVDTNGDIINIDSVTDDDWNARRSSSLEHPTADYPIVNIIDNKLVFYPLSINTGKDNILSNAGFEGDSDWVVTGGGAIADDWEVAVDGTPSQGSDNFGFSGVYQGIRLDNTFNEGGIIYIPSSNTILPGRYSVSFKYYIEDSTGDTTINVAINNEIVYSTSPTQSTSTAQQISASFDVTRNQSFPGFQLNCTNSVVNNAKDVYFDEVYFGESLDITLNYLKQSATPYFDWYYDANDRIQYLDSYVSTPYTLQTGETYIDKEDSSILTATDTIGSIANGDDANNKTVEMEIPDDEKRLVFYSILSKNGISLDQTDTAQYSMQMEAKENIK